MTNIRKVVLLGSRGMLGRAFLNLLEERQYDLICIDRPDYELSQSHDLKRIPISTGDTVINCVAWAAVDDAESHEEEATKINGWMVGQLAQLCAKAHARFVHFSTDYVFCGESKQPYMLDEPWSPINAYGRSKVEGERELLAIDNLDYLLIRTSWLYAPWAKNFVRTIASLARSRPQLRVVNDQRGRPTSVEYLAKITLALLERQSNGIYHVCDGGECSWFEFAAEIARQVQSSCVVEGCTSEEYPTAARRPHYSVLDISRVENELGPLRDWRDNLAEVIPRIE